MQLAIVAALILLLAVCAIAVVVTGPLAEAVGDAVRPRATRSLTTWDIAKWPVIALVVLTMFAVLYYAAPNVSQPGFRWITPGGSSRWSSGSSRRPAFALLRRQLRLLQQDLRHLAGVMVFLVWLWISNLAVLLAPSSTPSWSARRELEGGVPEEHTLAIEPRNEPKQA